MKKRKSRHFDRKSRDFDKSVNKNSVPKSIIMHRIAVTLAIFLGIILGLLTFEDNTPQRVKFLTEVYPKLLKFEMELLKKAKVVLENIKKKLTTLKILECLPCRKRYVVSLLGYIYIIHYVPEEEQSKETRRYLYLLRFCPKELKKFNRNFKRLQINNGTINKSRLRTADMQVLAVSRRRANVVLRRR